MPGTVLIASHLPGEGHFHSSRFSIEPVRCEGPFDYWEGLAKYWDSDLTIVNLEHDLEVSDEHAQALIDCPHPACSWAYLVHWASTGLRSDVIAAGHGRRDPHSNPDPEFIREGEEWAAWSAIGLVKLTAEARIGSLRREPWQRLELSVHDAVKRPWHMHWPAVPHHHW